MSTVVKSTRAITFGEAIEPFRKARIPAPALLPIAPPDAPVAENSSLARNRKSLGKVPSRFDVRRGEWTGLGGNAITEGLDKQTREQALQWPTGNVGVLGRAFPAIDVDVGSEAARQLVERAVRTVFGQRYAERRRGTGPRRLFAFRSDPKLDPSRRVSKATWEFRMPGEGEGDTPHKVDILGYGQQFVAAGIHPSGDTYEWDPERDLCAMVEAGRIEFIERADIERLRDEFERTVQEIGGTARMPGDSGHGAGGGQVYNYGRDEPVTDPSRIFDALWKMPNTEANFGLRDDFIGVVASIRAALGCNAFDEEWENEVRGWAVDTSDGFCDEDYFDKVWESLRSGVQCGRDRLSIILRKHNVHDLDGIAFEDDSEAGSAAGASRKISGYKAGERNERQKLLDRAAKIYVFQRVDTSKGRKFQPMRLRVLPNSEMDAADWWQGLTTDKNVELLADLRNTFGRKKDDLFEFLRALQEHHPFAFFTREIRHPGFEYGAVVQRRDTRGYPDGALNLRPWSQAQIAANQPRRNLAQAKADWEHFREFISLGFGDGEIGKYVLDTLAYMAQTGKRPGHMLVLEGDQGVGKSLFVEFLIALFDGTGDHVRSRVNGAKLMNEGSRRFLLAGTEGARVITLKELPKGTRSADIAAIISEIKQVVDAGTAGDYIEIEAKGKDARSIENHGYFIITTNYENVIPMEEQDRRIFYVRFRIERAFMPRTAFYDRLGAIMETPERLAAIWDGLEHIDIAAYQPRSAPPVTDEKKAYQLEGIYDDAERHMEVALRTLEHGDRWIFTQEDIVQLMNEAWRREGEDDSGPEPYSPGTVGRNGLTMGALKRLQSRTAKFTFKSGSKRYPTLYVLKSQATSAAGLHRDELFQALAADRDGCPLREMVPIAPYRGELDLSPISEEAGADGADDELSSRRSGGRQGGTVVDLPVRRRAGSRG